MTPQERQLIDDLFDRLAALERQPRDPEAERAIAQGLARAPHAPYALVQTVLVQDEALKLAEDRIRELGGEIGEPSRERGFLDTMREALLGPDPKPRRSAVPLVRPGAPTRPGAYGQPAPEHGGRGGSFLGTAAATAAGVIGGSLLIDSLRSMWGQGQAQASPSAFGDSGAWADSSGSDLSRQAGLDDIGRTREDRSTGLLDTTRDDQADPDFDAGGDFGGDFGGDGGD